MLIFGNFYFVCRQPLKVHAVADDLQIYGSTTQKMLMIWWLGTSIFMECVASWMSHNRLRLYPSRCPNRQHAAHSLVWALIHTRVGLLVAGLKFLLEKLQFVLRDSFCSSNIVSDLQRQLHWLEMPDRVKFKLGMLVYRCLHVLLPHCLSKFSCS